MAPLRASLLVVDDDPNVAGAVAAMAAAAGHDVTTASSVEDALELAGRRSFDLVISDVVLGRRDGLDLAEALVPLQPGIRVLFMSGYAALAHRSPDDVVLAKPFGAGELQARIESALTA